MYLLSGRNHFDAFQIKKVTKPFLQLFGDEHIIYQ